MKQLIYLMGVSGSGKSTTGEALASLTGGTFLDGDDYHPPANKEKMAAGTPLTDDDRWPWLDRLREVGLEHLMQGESPVIIACSALKQVYRDRLLADWTAQNISANMVHLVGSRELISDRLSVRQHEYMPATLLDSQFATLEQPQDGEGIIEVSVNASPSEIAKRICETLKFSL